MLCVFLVALGVVSALAFSEAPGLGGFLKYTDFAGSAYTVAYDNRSLFLNGQRAAFNSAGIHYPRFTPQQWDDLFLKASNDGYNMIQTYVFVNAHAPKLSVWPWIFEGPSDLPLFLTKAAAAGFFVNLRIGPYVCAEWAWGGYPFDLATITDIQSRSSNPAWEAWMGAVVINVTQMLRPFFADRGGPIVLAQVENELHTSDQKYVDFCGQLTIETGVSIPWEMCNGNSANVTINSCNSGDCTSFIESNGQNGQVLITQPGLWTENWMGWFASWGDSGPAGDWPIFDATGQSSGKSASILRWFARGGSHINFYNWAGGNHFARNAGSSMVSSYYWDAPIASDNLDQGPERLHMARTYRALAAVMPQVLAAPAQLRSSVQVPYYSGGSGGLKNDSSHIAFVYEAIAGGGGVDCAFLENSNGAVATFSWRGFNYSAPSGSTLVWANGSVIFSSSVVIPSNRTHVWTAQTGLGFAWSSWQDSSIPATPGAIPTPTAPRAPWIGSALGAVVANATPIEAVSMTEYDSELLPYSTVLSPATVAAILKGAGAGNESAVPVVVASAHAQALTVFANGALVGAGFDLAHADGAAQIAFAVNFSALVGGGGGEVVLTILSTSLGVGNGGGVNNVPPSHENSAVKGITSASARAVLFGGVDITSAAPWTHQAGSSGEALGAFRTNGSAAVPWSALPAGATGAPPMTWLRTNFTAPAEAFPPPAGVEQTAALNLDASGLGRGRFWVNGFDLGRYWSKLCGPAYMCQRYYNIPSDLLLEGEGANVLVVLDETGPTNITNVSLAVSTNAAPPACPALPATGGNATTTPCGDANSRLQQLPSDVGDSSSTLLASVASNATLCLAVLPAQNAPGGGGPLVAFEACNASSLAQAWVLPTSGSGAVSNAALSASDCLDVDKQQSGEGVPLDMYACNGGSNQAFTWLNAGPAGQGSLAAQLDSGAECVGFCG